MTWPHSDVAILPIPAPAERDRIIRNVRLRSRDRLRLRTQRPRRFAHHGARAQQHRSVRHVEQLRLRDRCAVRIVLAVRADAARLAHDQRPTRINLRLRSRKHLPSYCRLSKRCQPDTPRGLSLSPTIAPYRSEAGADTVGASRSARCRGDKGATFAHSPTPADVRSPPLPGPATVARPSTGDGPPGSTAGPPPTPAAADEPAAGDLDLSASFSSRSRAFCERNSISSSPTRPGEQIPHEHPDSPGACAPCRNGGSSTRSASTWSPRLARSTRYRSTSSSPSLMTAAPGYGSASTAAAATFGGSACRSLSTRSTSGEDVANSPASILASDTSTALSVIPCSRHSSSKIASASAMGAAPADQVMHVRQPRHVVLACGGLASLGGQRLHGPPQLGFGLPNAQTVEVNGLAMHAAAAIPHAQHPKVD